MTESSQTNKLAEHAKRLGQLFLQAGAHRTTIERTMRKLQTQGLIRATMHWRDDRYLYLLHPSKVGEPRKREYVGTDAKRINAAKEAIARAARYDALKKELATLNGGLWKASRLLSDAVKEVEQLL